MITRQKMEVFQNKSNVNRIQNSKVKLTAVKS